MNKSGRRETTTRPPSGETRQRLLDAAGPLIAERGWGRVTTRAVAERAGLPLGAVSYHFHGKHEMLRQAVVETVEAIVPLDDVARTDSLQELRQLVRTALGNRASLDAVTSRMLMEAMREAGRDAALGQRLTRLLVLYRGELARLVRVEQDRGAVPEEIEPEAAATLLAAAGDGLMLHALVDPTLDVVAAFDTLLGRLAGGGLRR